jgi:hypothetical protein
MSGMLHSLVELHCVGMVTQFMDTTYMSYAG